MLLSCLLLFALANTVSAHTGLETSVPKDGEVVTEQVKEIVLNFETKIEQGSTFELHGVNGLGVPVTSITLNEKQIEGTVEEPLENAEYLVYWKIIGADGHPIEGEFTFYVEIEQTEESNEEPIEKPVDGDKELEDPPNSTPPSSNEPTEPENQEKSLPTSILVLILILLIGILIGTFLMFFRRKKES